MTRKNVLPALIAGALVLVAIFGAATYQKVWAQAPTPSTTDPAVPQTQDALPGRGELRALKGGHIDGANQEDLAAALGITVEELQAAHTEANEAALAQAVSQGLIIQAQADQLKANGLSGRRLGKFGRGLAAANGIDYQALLADALGITTDELKAAQAEAFTTALDRAVTEGRLTQEQADQMQGRYNLANDSKFQSSMQSAFQAAVQQAVTDGVITQAQADQILAENSGMKFFGGPGGMRGPGGHGKGGRGGPGGRGEPGGLFNQQTPAVPSPAAPSSGGA